MAENFVAQSVGVERDLENGVGQLVPVLGLARRVVPAVLQNCSVTLRPVRKREIISSKFPCDTRGGLRLAVKCILEEL